MSERVKVLDETETRLKQAEKRIGSITNQLHDAQKESEELKNKPTEEQIAEAAASQEKWDELNADFPEWGEAIGYQIGLVRKEMEKLGKPVDIEALRSEITASNDADIDERMQLAVLTVFHPKWRTIKDSKDFIAWKAGLDAEEDKEILAKLDTSEALDAIDVLDAFVASRGTSKTAAEIAEERKARLRKAENPKGKKAPAPKSDADLTDAEFREKEGKRIFAED